MKSKNVKTNTKIGAYLAGLIEGDGAIKVPTKEKSLKGKKYHPIIRVVFHKNDLPLAEHLKNSLGVGRLQTPGLDKGYVLWAINSRYKRTNKNNTNNKW